MAERPGFDGPALFSYGFRPFFLAACLFALAAVPVWLMIWQGSLGYAGPLAASDWHIHEMVFGYGGAVVTGFLFTAVPNWTGRLPVRGWPLAGLLALWLAGRLALFGALPVPPVLAAAVDCSFLAGVAALAAREIIAGKNWRNLMVLGPVSLLAVCNALFFAEALAGGVADDGRRGGLAVLVFLILLIGGRIVPSFTRNWLAKAGAEKLPVPFGRFDGIALLAAAAGLAAWVAAPWSAASGGLLLLAAALQMARLKRWRGGATWRNPLLFMLHAAFAFAPAGMAAAGLVPFGLADPAAGAHLLGIGAAGGMTVAVMMRATMGHTGRALVAGPALTGAFACIVLAAAARLGGAEEVLPGLDGYVLSAAFWTIGFAILCWRLGPWLLLPQQAKKRPNPSPQGGRAV